MSNADSEYRKNLQTLEHKSQEFYDKSILTLSGGALGVSFAFVKDIVGKWPPEGAALLLLAWLFWAMSLSSVLFSFFFSQRALRRAIEQVDATAGQEERLGGLSDTITSVLNICGGVCFLLGVIAVMVFVSINMGDN